MKIAKCVRFTGIVLLGLCLLGVNAAQARSEISQREGNQLKRHHPEPRKHSYHHRQYKQHHHHHHYGYHVKALPRNSFSLTFGGLRFYYDDGIYYRRSHNGYIVVAPPRGVHVKRIPVNYQPIVYNGITYYTDGGIYYIYTSSGYQVVPPPVTYVQAHNSVLVSAPKVETKVVATNDDFFTVNIPNEKTGGYTEVTIKRTENGFLGPQGEFYPEFPRVEQLKAMYLVAKR